jgi:sugar porter (SP) family MFS transporter
MSQSESINSSRIIIIAICSALSGLLFGYDAGIISGALLFIKKSFVMTASTVGWMVAMVPVGALISSVLSGYFSDIVGRKKALFFTAVCFIIGTILCMDAQGVDWLVIGRIIIGLAIGVGSCISPVYTSELANEKQRGWLVNLFVVTVQVGVFLAFLIGYLLSDSGDWRMMIGLGIIPAILLGVATFFLPESPRWLIVKGKAEQAKAVLEKLYGFKEASKVASVIEETVDKDKINWKILFEQPRFLKVIFIGIAVSAFTQTVGINAFNYYGPTIFQSTGFATPSQATFYTMFMGLTLALSTIASLFFIDKIGRKLPLLLGTFAILIILGVITFGFGIITNPLDLGLLFFVSAIIFMFFHGLSIGPACFLIPSEIFPSRIRGLGMGISVACNWGVNVLVAAYIPSVIKDYGVSVLFGGFFILTLIGLIVFYYFVPETKGTTLESIENNVINNVRARDLGKTL